jgi:hypothetical protein
LIPNGADTAGHNPCRAIAFRGHRRTARPLEARLRPISRPQRGPRLVQHVIQVTACCPGENLWCSPSFVCPICISPTMQVSAERASVGSTEASDGRLARVGRIAASALHAWYRGAPQQTLRGSGWNAQHVPLGNNLATAVAMSPQRDYKMTRPLQDRKWRKHKGFRRYRNVLPRPRLGRPSGFRS